MVGKENPRAEDLNLCFEKLMMPGSGGGRKVKMEAGATTEWKDIPMELLLQIVSIVDDKTVIVATGVCRGWREAICMGRTHLSLSWYMFCFLLSLSLLSLQGRFLKFFFMCLDDWFVEVCKLICCLYSRRLDVVIKLVERDMSLGSSWAFAFFLIRIILLYLQVVYKPT